MKRAIIICKNEKQFNIAKAITENLMQGLLSCWGVKYFPNLVDNTGEYGTKSEFDTTFEDFIKGWYGDVSNQEYL